MGSKADATPPESASTTRSKPTRRTSDSMKPTRIDCTSAGLSASSPESRGSATTAVAAVPLSERAFGSLIPAPLQLTQRELDVLLSQQRRRRSLPLHLPQVDLGQRQPGLVPRLRDHPAVGA